MGVQNFVNTAARGQRQAKRARVLLTARLLTSSGELEVRLRDLSRKGALIECMSLPAVGSDVVLARGSVSIPARIAWAKGRRIGLEFEHPIDERSVLVRLKEKTGSQPDVRFRRPRFNESLKDHERELARVWGVTVGLTVPDTD